jgi:hypothetical protein
MQLADGKRFVERLITEGIPVIGACWLKVAEAGQWFLYLVTPLVEEEGRRSASMRVNAILRQMPEPFWIGYGETRLVGPDSPVGQAMQDLLKRPRPSSVLRDSEFGGVSIEGIYPYPPVKVPS